MRDRLKEIAKSSEEDKATSSPRFLFSFISSLRFLVPLPYAHFIPLRPELPPERVTMH